MNAALARVLLAEPAPGRRKQARVFTDLLSDNVDVGRGTPQEDVFKRHLGYPEALEATIDELLGSYAEGATTQVATWFRAAYARLTSKGEPQLCTSTTNRRSAHERASNQRAPARSSPPRTPAGARPAADHDDAVQAALLEAVESGVFDITTIKRRVRTLRRAARPDNRRTMRCILPASALWGDDAVDRVATDGPVFMSWRRPSPSGSRPPPVRWS